ncbi:MAG: hypothetical protein M3O20_02400 [Acidobacteriota bacterium]|nr:hypothetical protein [Acidobacteriota bacterium]
MTRSNTQTRKAGGWALLILLGTSIPGFAQIDISGSWPARNHSDALGNNPGPEPTPVDYMGIPLNPSGLAKALAHSTSQLSMPERVCAFYSPVYVMLGPFGLKLWNETEPRNGTTIAWKIGGWEDLAEFTIWMDGRPHPSKYAPHEMSGFTTGVWEDDILNTYTTHMKAGISRRNGAPTSDQTTMTMHFLVHGDELTVTARVEDPVYLTEPFYLTRTFQRTAMNPMRSVGQPCIQGNEGIAEGVVPHYLPGKNLFVDEMTKVYNIPAEAALGGAETMYPEYRKKIKDKYVVPEKCPRACGGPGLYPLRAF